MEPERLTATDEAFLAIEGLGIPMHVGVLLVLDGVGMVDDAGTLDVGAIRERMRVATLCVPRLRQRLLRTPGLGCAWVDDERFDLDDHVEEVPLPHPGGRAELMEAAARLFAPALDRSRPLWKLWAISGLEGQRFAIAIAAHHAMVDGVGGIGLLAAMLTGRALTGTEGAPSAELAAPSRLALARFLALDRAHRLRSALRALRAPDRPHATAATVLAGMARVVADGLTPAPRTAINPRHVSPRRGFAGVRLDLGRALAIRAALGGTVNDVVLTTIAGALRRHLAQRGDVSHLRPFRALVPVDLRARTGEAHPMGNSVGFFLTALPITEPDPRARHAAVRATTERLKRTSHEIEASAGLEGLADVLAPRLVELVFRITAKVRAFHVVVTNLRGPRDALHLGPARIEEAYGLVPLFAQQGLGVAVLSYDGGLFVGIHTDGDVIADPREVAREVEAAFDELALAALPADRTAPGAAYA